MSAEAGCRRRTKNAAIAVDCAAALAPLIESTSSSIVVGAVLTAVDFEFAGDASTSV